MTEYCNNHPEKKAVSFCQNCKQYYCEECLNEAIEYYYCNKSDCYEKYSNEDKRINALETNKSKSKFIYILFTIIIASIFGVFGKELANYLFNSSVDQKKEAKYLDSNWQERKLNNTNLILEAPFSLSKFSLNIHEQYKSLINEIYSYQHISDDFSLAVNYYQYIDDINPNMDGAAKGAVDNMKIAGGYTNYQYSIKKTFKDKFEGRLIKSNFSIKKNRGEALGIIFSKGQKFWSIISTFPENRTNEIIAERIINSIKITIDDSNNTFIRDKVYLKTEIDSDNPGLNESFNIKFVLYTRLNISSPKILKLPSFSELKVRQKDIDNIQFELFEDNGIKFRRAVIQSFTLKAENKGTYLITPLVLEVPVIVNKNESSKMNYVVEGDFKLIDM